MSFGNESEGESTIVVAAFKSEHGPESFEYPISRLPDIASLNALRASLVEDIVTVNTTLRCVGLTS